MWGSTPASAFATWRRTACAPRSPRGAAKQRQSRGYFPQTTHVGTFNTSVLIAVPPSLCSGSGSYVHGDCPVGHLGSRRRLLRVDLPRTLLPLAPGLFLRRGVK